MEQFDKTIQENAITADHIFPCILSNWDHSPRSKENATILTKNTPEKFGKLLKKILEYTSARNNNIIFIKSWNEWGEGNYLEPDLKFGHGYLNEIKKLTSL